MGGLENPSVGMAAGPLQLKTVPPRLLVVSTNDLSPELGRTICWRSDIQRVVARDADTGFEIARSLQPSLMIVDLEDSAATLGLIRRVRSDPTARGTAIVAFNRLGSTVEEESLAAAGARPVFNGPVDPSVWDAKLEQLLSVPPRRSTRLRVRLRVWSRLESQEEIFDGEALDISVNGMLLETEMGLEVGAKVDLFFCLAEDSVELSVVAQVVRQATAPSGLPRSGVEFLVLRGDARERIGAFVDTGARAAIEERPEAVAEATAAEITQWEAELRASEARKAAVLDSALDCIITLDHTGSIREINRAAEATFGFTRAQVVGRRAIDLIVAPSSRDECRQTWAVAQDASLPPSDRTEIVAMRSDGSQFPAELALTTITHKGKRFLSAYVRDIGERKRAEDLLKASERRFRSLFDSAQDAIVITDDEGRYVEVNRAACALHGLAKQELLGHWLGDFAGPGFDFDSSWQILRKEGAASGEFRILRSDGTARVVEFTATAHFQPGSHLAILRDVTDRRHLEEKLRLPQKMEAVGRLAGGIAHDFNNLLAVILGYSSLGLSRMSDPDGLRRSLEQIRRASERAAALTRQLLAFSRKQVLIPQVLNLGGLVMDLDHMLQRLIGEDIEFVTHIEPGLGKVKADPGQVEQVIVNLAVNARDAMPDGGKLAIEVRNIDLDEFYAREHLGARAGPHVMLSVTDTGIGMDAETKSHIFEPFFTTKEKGKGTGLGLATVYGIVKQSGGYIAVDSEPGRGTNFTILFPRVEEAVAAVKPAPAPAMPAGGSETILLVEDEAAVRNLIRDTLESYGYHVLEAGGGSEALRLSREHQGPLPLLLTDVVMPGMSGRAVAQAISAARPETRILYASGYTDEAIARHGVLDPGTDFIQKPFSPDDLARRVREVLDRPRKE